MCVGLQTYGRGNLASNPAECFFYLKSQYSSNHLQRKAAVNYVFNWMWLAKVPFASYDTKCKLFSSYCTSFYGSQSWDLSSRHIQKLLTSWNKCVRRLLNLQYTTHRALLPDLIGLKPLMHDLVFRFYKYVRQWILSKNSMVQYLILRSMYGFYGTLGQSIRYLF